jgi:dihydroorotase-like cyclic amidohydrolase
MHFLFGRHLYLAFRVLFDTRPLSKGLAFDPKGMPDVEQPGLVDSDGHFQDLAARTKETTHSADQSAQLW